LCLGEEFTYNAPAGLDSYVWNRDGNIIAGATTNELRVDEAGIYSLTIEQDGCTDQSDDLVVTFTTLPSLDDLPTTTSLCAGEEFTFEAPAGLDSYVWSKDGVVIAGATTNELSVGEEGTYSLIIEQNGCSASSVALEIEVITLDPLEVAPSTTFICGDEEVLLFLDVFNYDSIFLASNGEIISSDQDEIFVSESGIYTLVGKTGNCTIESNSFEFIFSDFPEITPVASEAFACPGENATLAVTGQEDLEYTWSNEGGQVVGTGMSIEVTIPGVYISEVLDQETGCAMSTSITFSNYEITIPTIMVDENNLTSSDGEAYQWYVDGVLIPDANAITFTADGTGDYQVAVTDMNGCIIFSEIVFIELTSTQTISDILSADLFPNPTSDRLALTLTTDASLDLEITVYNQLGQSIWTTQVQQQGEQTYAIPVVDMTAGLYYLRVKNQQGHQQTYKFIKQ